MCLCITLIFIRKLDDDKQRLLREEERLLREEELRVQAQHLNSVQVQVGKLFTLGKQMLQNPRKIQRKHVNHMVALITHILSLSRTRAKDSIQRLWKKAFIPVRTLLRHSLSTVMQKVSKMVERIHLLDDRLKHIYTLVLFTACGVLLRNRSKLRKVISFTRRYVSEVLESYRQNQ